MAGKIRATRDMLAAKTHQPPRRFGLLNAITTIDALGKPK
eukprot:CAMPEP_0184320402 /NCGR_PEP_ID=MMETSP1049-20130417/113840_1 /TAXON_ID=77928 /ORGANISM="Proteomonas sulcata, Strain CCMP704" /LENGTH=39 /DNA_ID= /DNA_START= /DNA_END= /DNA_ORIENTATION=